MIHFKNECVLAVAAGLCWISSLGCTPGGTRTLVYVDQSATASSPDGSSWALAYTDLQDALDVAASNAQILVAEGVYAPSKRTDPDDPRSATFDLDFAVTIRGGYGSGGSFRSPGDHETVVSGNFEETSAKLRAVNNAIKPFSANARMALGPVAAKAAPAKARIPPPTIAPTPTPVASSRPSGTKTTKESRIRVREWRA